MTFRKKDLQVPGTYILLLHAALERDVTIGAAGILSLRQGYYAYVGSAFGPGGLYARLASLQFDDVEPALAATGSE